MMMSSPTIIVAMLINTAFTGTRSIGNTVFVRMDLFADTDPMLIASASAVTRYGTRPLKM